MRVLYIPGGCLGISEPSTACQNRERSEKSIRFAQAMHHGKIPAPSLTGRPCYKCVLAVLCLEIFQLSSCFKCQGVIKNWKTQRYMHSNYWLWCILLWYVVIVYVDSVAQANSTENSSTSNTSNGTSNGTSNSTQGTPGSVVSDGQLCLCNLSNLSSVSESQFFDVFWWDHVRILRRNGMKGIWWWYLRTWL